ncbi:MAG: flagellar hook-basal body protein [Firmicutes bacterium]|nr:flagellar hook-basal body protein [Bacillota bacterium]
MTLLGTAASGLQSQTARLDAIANNIANLDTVGYQSVGVSFADTLSQVYGQSPDVSALPQRDTPTGAVLGTGVYALPGQRAFTAGAYQQTGQPLDMAIEGDGFFTVGLPNGQTGYTRAGSFTVSENAQTRQFDLTTAQGAPVLDVAGKPIDMTGVDLQSVQVSPTGVLTGQTMTGRPVTIGQLGLGYVNDPTNALHSVGADVYASNPGYQVVTNAKQGPLGAGLMGSVKDGTLEMSNVNLTQQMSDMLETQQNFQLSSEAFNIADKMLGLAAVIK